MVVKIRVSCWVLHIVRHLVFRVPKRDPNFDSHPYGYMEPLGLQESAQWSDDEADAAAGETKPEQASYHRLRFRAASCVVFIFFPGGSVLF